MIVDVVMPQQGLTITEATLIRWVKQPGDPVTAEELLFEVETDKAAVEVESPASGRLLVCLAAEGETVPFGRVIAKIGTEAGDTVETGDMMDAAAPLPMPGDAPPVSNGHRPHVQTPADVPEDVRPVASPRARRAAERLGVDLRSVQATGRRGKHIRECDVLLVSERRPAPPAAPILPQSSPKPGAGPSRLRRLTAQRTAASFRDVPHFYLTREVSAERLLAFRAEIVEGVQERAGVRVTVTDLLLRALAVALGAAPEVNAQWDGEGVTPLTSVDLGLAVDTPDGLIVPVLHGADTLSVAATARRRAELVERAREGRSLPEDLAGGSFTLSNLGVGGVDQFDAIINAPQSGILGVGAIKQRPYVVGGVLAAAHTLILTVSMDHRVVDGASAARFLSHVADLLENPALLCAL